MSENHDDFQKNFGMMVAGFGFGMLVGSILGLLFAPKSGRELRSDISERSVEFYGKAREGVSDAYRDSVTKLNEAYSHARDALEIAYSTSRDFTKEKVEKVKAAVDEGVKVAKDKIQKKSSEDGDGASENA